MAIISNNGNIIKTSDGRLAKYGRDVNRFTWFTTYNYGLRNYYVDNVDYVPDPILGNGYNTNVQFVSSSPGEATVDWGDGTVEVFPLVKEKGSSTYRIIFRSLNIEFSKNPSDRPWWFYKEDGSDYIPIPPHHYDDDLTDVERVVVVNFSCDIHTASIFTCRMTSFPIIEIPFVENLTILDTVGIPSIPQDRLARATRLRSIELYSIGARMTYLSDGITNKENLETLGIGQCFNFSDLDNSGIRNIKNLKKLKSFSNSSNYIRTYIKEYNDLPNLSLLNINQGPFPVSGINDTPVFEVDKINPSITRLSFLAGWESGEIRTEWPNHMEGKGLENIVYLDFSHQSSLRMDIMPNFILEMRSMATLGCPQTLVTQVRADDFVRSFYSLVTGWDNITMTRLAMDGKRNQFYSLSVITYSPAHLNNYRPSGTYQEPSGFVLGSNNGNPSSPMEMIYVLQKNYKQEWSIPSSSPT